MENFIKYVNIHNFKSIIDLKLEDCRRINLFIGYPNVGKSNVLEALSLFSVPFLNKDEKLNKLVRVEHPVELFHSSSEQYLCTIGTNLQKIKLELNPYCFQIFHDKGEEQTSFSFHSELKLVEKLRSSNSADKANLYDTSNIKRYTFNLQNKWKTNNKYQLLPPYGENITDVLSYRLGMEDVTAFIKTEFAKYDLKLVLNIKDKSVLVQQNLNEDRVFQLPYTSLADTLQRVIFYKTAIASNKNSVLLFEEPEVHAFPPYIRNITQDIVDAKTNQFFIVTHSPFVVNDFLEYADLRKETSIYLFDFKNNQTIAKRLTDDEMDEVYNYGIDLFYNIESFLRDE